MTSRERVSHTLRHERTDRIPVDFWASKGTVRKIERRLGLPYDRYLDHHDVDFRYISGPRYIGPPLADGCDIWGVRRTLISLPQPDGSAEEYEELAAAPLAAAGSAPAIAEYAHWPSADRFDYSGIEAQCDAVLAKGRVVVFMGDRLNRVAQLKPAMYLRGIENILMDLALAPEIAVAIFARIREFYEAYLDRTLTAARGKIDIVCTGDDFGSQNGLLVSRDMWREFLRPGFAAYLDLIRRHGATSMHHTCGAVAELVPDLIDAGLDILQSLQPEAPGMALENLLPRFGERLAFQGGISIQRALPFGTPDEIRAEVRRIADLAGRHGGYIFCTAHNIQADTPIENIQALMAAYHDLAGGNR